MNISLPRPYICLPTKNHTLGKVIDVHSFSTDALSVQFDKSPYAFLLVTKFPYLPILLLSFLENFIRALKPDEKTGYFSLQSSSLSNPGNGIFSTIF